MKRSLGCQPGADGVRRPVLQTMVEDPATGTTMSWQEDDPAKIVHVLHHPPVKLPPARTDAAADADARRAMEAMGIHMEDLGSKSIAGVMAKGIRTEQTVPAGQYVTQPIKIVGENWIAEDLDLQMMSLDDNSKTGRRVDEIVKLTRGEPDPALFVPPAGYTIVDNKPKQ